MSDYISDQLRAKAAALRNSISAPMPAWQTMQGETRGAAQAKELAESEGARKAANQEAYVAAVAEWEGLRGRIPDTLEGRTLRELLDLHKPWQYERGWEVRCEHCWEEDYDIERVEWECASYAVIRQGMT